MTTDEIERCIRANVNRTVFVVYADGESEDLFVHHVDDEGFVCDIVAAMAQPPASAKNEPLKFVREVTFTRGRPTADTYIPFRFSWIIALRDEGKLIVDVGASAPTGKEMIFHAVRLQLA